jgi:hypothetical protein
MNKLFDNPKILLGISLFCFIMALTSAVIFLLVESPSLMPEAFLGYTICGIAFFAMGMLKGLE